MIFSIPSKIIKEIKDKSIEMAGIVNLLDNSNFTNPVNDNGASSYSGSKETITKWISRSGYGVVTVNEDCVNIKSSNGTTAAYVLQFLENGKIKSGKKYTVACELKDGSIHCITGEASTSMTEVTRYIYVDEVQLGTIRFRYDTSEAKYAVMFSTLSTSGLNIVNVGLYEGEYTNDNLPKYQPKGYGVEAVNCHNAQDIKLLWENASPTSAFAVQTVNLNLSEYRFIYVQFKASASGLTHCFSDLIAVIGEVSTLFFYTNAKASQKRNVKPYNNIIYFEAGTKDGTTDNSVNIPIRIYGVK